MVKRFGHGHHKEKKKKNQHATFFWHKHSKSQTGFCHFRVCERKETDQQISRARKKAGCPHLSVPRGGTIQGRDVVKPCSPTRDQAGDGTGDARGLPRSHDRFAASRTVLLVGATSGVLQTAVRGPSWALSSLLGPTAALWLTGPLSAESGPGCPKPASTEGAEELLWAQARPEGNPPSPTSIAENRTLLFSRGSSLPRLRRHQRPGANGAALRVPGDGAAQPKGRAIAGHSSTRHINFRPGDVVRERVFPAGIFVH